MVRPAFKSYLIHNADGTWRKVKRSGLIQWALNQIHSLYRSARRSTELLSTVLIRKEKLHSEITLYSVIRGVLQKGSTSIYKEFLSLMTFLLYIFTFMHLFPASYPLNVFTKKTCFWCCLVATVQALLSHYNITITYKSSSLESFFF